MQSSKVLKKQNIDFHVNSLKENFSSGIFQLFDDLFIWRGTLQPTPCSKIYDVQIKYEPFERPEVRILTRGLILPAELGDIHIFSDVNRYGSLCLYKKEWNPEMEMAKSIIPWTCEWLLFYELWQITGKWGGGGVHT